MLLQHIYVKKWCMKKIPHSFKKNNWRRRISNVGTDSQLRHYAFRLPRASYGPRAGYVAEILGIDKGILWVMSLYYAISKLQKLFWKVSWSCIKVEQWRSFVKTQDNLCSSKRCKFHSSFILLRFLTRLNSIRGRSLQYRKLDAITSTSLKQKISHLSPRNTNRGRTSAKMSWYRECPH